MRVWMVRACVSLWDVCMYERFGAESVVLYMLCWCVFISVSVTQAAHQQPDSNSDTYTLQFTEHRESTDFNWDASRQGQTPGFVTWSTVHNLMEIHRPVRIWELHFKNQTHYDISDTYFKLIRILPHP